MDEEKHKEISREGQSLQANSKQDGNQGGRGLASADQETRERVASAGGNAPHEVRGLQGADEETRQRVASEGGRASSKAQAE